MSAARPHLTHWARVRHAVVWDALVAMLGDDPLDVVDAGGGTGGIAVPLAALGHRVTVVDPSPDALAALEQRAAEEGVSVSAVQGDLTALGDAVPAASADVVICHGVLEVVDQPAIGAAALAAVLRAGGLASVVAANRTAAVFSRAITGRFAEATHAFADPDGRWGAADSALRRFDRDALLAMLQDAGLTPVSVHGVRAFTDLVPGGLLDGDPVAFEALLALELQVADTEPYAAVATQLHVLARKV